MDFTSKFNTTLPETGDAFIQSPVTLGLTAVVVAFFSLLAFVSYAPKVHKQAPAFTSDTLPILGSTGFTTRQWSFWKGASAESKTGNFSFWLGNRHVVGITGPAARKMFFDHPDLDFVSGAIILPFGVHFWPPIHEIFRPGFHNGRSNTFFLRRLLELMKSEQLNKYLPDLLKDARTSFEDLMVNNPSGVTKPPEIWRTVFKQNCRLVFTDEVADNPELFKSVSDNVDTLLHTFSHYNVPFPWLPSPSYLRRRMARRGIVNLVSNVVNKRLANGAQRKDDPVQILIENKDRKDYIIEFFVSALFISTTNAHVMAGQMLNIMAIHTDWQDKIYSEIKAAAEKHAAGPSNRTVVDKLASLPLEAWENSFPTLDLCLKEAIRMWTSFSVTRLNLSANSIPIPGSDEVVPGNTFVIYNSTEVNFSEELYPNPTKFDPERFLEGREEFKKETYGFLGWGQGKHPCAGIRWAKLQQTIIVVYALAMYKWSSCDENGEPDPYAMHRRELDSKRSFVLPPAYSKLEPRE
ncbi:putative cytochrome P450 oxidoreductase [Podospora appendiculata]|uniref:Cytochrome P450 oxidoreductase n=1 Tax=Podospora appendiculata TaxID=314037 RepID=A0AAE0WZL1_9PEZI|nr:putative cytochrome P450 oxidoreductase [Podospora appendiculata]